MKLKKHLSLLIALILTTTILLSACQPAASTSPTEPTKETIKFADTQFQTLWINNAIAGYIIENGYDYPVETFEMTTPVAQQSLQNGDVDVFMELWRANLMDWYIEVTQSGDVIDLGDTYERSTQGWYVPRYVIEGDAERGIEPMAPDLKSVSDLPKYKDLFADPEDPSKGLLINCITGWQCAEINKIKVYAYGLDESYNILEPGSSGALDAAIASAYQKGKPVLSYYWEPTWLMGTYDMVQLEEPTYTQECWAEMEKSKNDDREIPFDEVQPSAGCAYESMGIHKGINKGLVESAPEIVEFLTKMNVTTDGLNKASAYMSAESASAEETAIWYLENYSNLWETWVPADVAEKVNQALTQ